MDTKRFLVTADHPVAKFACVDLLIECRETRLDAAGNTGWYANAHPYGCSKTYRKPEHAITEMLSDHACRNIRIRPA